MIEAEARVSAATRRTRVVLGQRAASTGCAETRSSDSATAAAPSCACRCGGAAAGGGGGCAARAAAARAATRRCEPTQRSGRAAQQSGAMPRRCAGCGGRRRVGSRLPRAGVGTLAPKLVSDDGRGAPTWLSRSGAVVSTGSGPSHHRHTRLSRARRGPSMAEAADPEAAVVAPGDSIDFSARHPLEHTWCVAGAASVPRGGR